MCHTFITREWTEDFTDSILKGYGRHGDFKKTSTYEQNEIMGSNRFGNCHQCSCTKEQDAHATSMVNSCQRKVAGVRFTLNYSILQLAPALEVIQVICLERVGTIIILVR